MKCRRLLLLAMFLGAPASALANPVSVASVDIDVSVWGEPVASVDVFYDELSPYGVWIEAPRFGLVFLPDDPQYVPYNVGYWQYTNVGFVWISSEPYAWATTHYGRWVYLNEYARWAWRPDTTWGPSWVEWRQFGDGVYFGWAPLAPELAIEIGYAPPIEYWHYCGATHLLDVQVSRYYEPRTRVVELHREARPFQNYATVGGARVIVGPSATILRQQRVDVRPIAIDARAMGRRTQDESRAAAARAAERRATIDEKNRQRLQSNPALRQMTPPTRQPQVQPPAKQPPAKQPQVQPPAKQQPAPRQPQVQQPAKEPQVQQPARQQPAPKQPQVQPPAKQPQAQQPARQPPAPRQPQAPDRKQPKR